MQIRKLAMRSFLAVGNKGILHTLYTLDGERMYVECNSIKPEKCPDITLSENRVDIVGEALKVAFGTTTITCALVKENVDCVAVFQGATVSLWGFVNACIYRAVDYDPFGEYLQYQPFIVHFRPEIFPYVRHKTPEMCLAAVERNGSLLEYVKEQTHEICRAAVSNDGNAIVHCQDPTEALQLLAVSNQPDAIRHIKNPSEDVIRLAVSTNGRAIRYVSNPTEELCEIAVRSTYSALLHIKNQTKHLCDIAIQHIYDRKDIMLRSVMAFNLVNGISVYEMRRYVCLRLVCIFPEAISYINPQDVDIHVRAVTLEPRCIAFVRNKHIAEMCQKIVHKPLCAKAIEDICTLVPYKALGNRLHREIGMCK